MDILDLTPSRAFLGRYYNSNKYKINNHVITKIHVAQSRLLINTRNKKTENFY
jgi:hypothetical protein